MRLPSFRRKLPPSAIVWLIVSGALAMLAFTMVRGEVARAERAQRAVGPMTAVVLAARDLASGDVVTSDDVRTGELPAIYAPPAAATSVETVVGMVTVGPVAAGETLVTTRLAGSVFAASLAPGDVAVTVGFASVPAGFSAADRVDAYATYAGARPYTTLVGGGLRVLAIGEPSATVAGPALVEVTLDVEPETARQLLQATASGVLGLAVHPAVTTSPSPSASPTDGWDPAPG